MVNTRVLARFRAVTVAAFAIATLSGVSHQAGPVVTGTLTDSATHKPVSGATVTAKDARDSVVATAQTNISGGFRLAVPRAARYTIDGRRLGYRGVSRVVTVPPDTVVDFRMSAIPYALDTVTANATQTTLFGLTPGRELFRRHMLEEKGQFVAGLEIQRSGLTVGDYLATLPGIRMTDAVSVGMYLPGDTVRWSFPIALVPGIPASNYRQLISASGTHCLYGRIDRFFIPDLLLPRGAVNIDDLLKVADITAVEVYLEQREMPVDWRSWAFLQDWFAVGPPYNVLMGTASNAANVSNTVSNDPSGRMTSAPAAPPWGWVHNGTKGATGHVHNAMIGPCGFIQIWTRIAW